MNHQLDLPMPFLPLLLLLDQNLLNKLLNKLLGKLRNQQNQLRVYILSNQTIRDDQKGRCGH
jgi:hypothetical protein